MSFTPVQIDELVDGEPTRTSSAEVAFQQGGVTFRGSIRPNPVNQINVTSQAQLEAELGTDLIIPAGTSVIIVIDDTFSLNKPFKKQAASSLFIKSQTLTKTLIYTGAPVLGALFQMDDPLLDVGSITQFDNVTISGNFGNECFALNDSLFNISNTVVIQNFSSLGTITAQLVKWTTVALISNLKGIAFIDTAVVDINMTGNSVGLPPPATTLMSFISTGRMDVIIENSQHVAGGLDNEFLFFDPNTDINSSIKVRDSGIISELTEALFQNGVDVTIASVADNLSGGIRCTATGHGQVNNTYAVLSGFLTATTYNGTFLITVINDDTFDVEVTFDVDDSGNVNRSSIDSTDPRLIAADNPDQPDSMASAQVGFTNIATPIPITIVTQDVPVLIGGTQFVSDNLERATATTGGQITNLTKATKKYPITFSALIEKPLGGPTDIGLLLIKNGSLVLTDTFEIPHSVNPDIVQISATRDFELAEGDTLELAVVSFLGIDNITVSQANIVYSVES